MGGESRMSVDIEGKGCLSNAGNADGGWRTRVTTVASIDYRESREIAWSREVDQQNNIM
jgi:hypothetical protein